MIPIETLLLDIVGDHTPEVGYILLESVGMILFYCPYYSDLEE